jgi:hypothetical protein
MFPMVLNEQASSNIARISQMNDFRQSIDSEHGALSGGEFKYTPLLSRSSSFSSSTRSLENVVDANAATSAIQNTGATNYLEKPSGLGLTKSNSDQKLPDSSANASNAFFYVNKNGFTVKNQISPPAQNAASGSATAATALVVTSSPKTIEQNKDAKQKKPAVICNELLVEMASNSKFSNKKNNQKIGYEKLKAEPESDRQSITRSVPNADLSSFLNSSNSSSDAAAGTGSRGNNANGNNDDNSLVRREANGQVIINTSMTMQEPSINITDEHVKYINIFSMLCCWCFPITGLLSVYYSKLTRKYYDRRDMTKAKKYLTKSEWMLILTFFFGFTLIAVAFALLEVYLFKSDERNKSLSHASSSFFHSRALPK